ncbi:TPA: glycosyltransferase [Vibrio diabolicus]
MISVIIPTYNNKLHLEATLASIAKQTLSNELFEVFVCDDGGVDIEVPRLIKKYTKYIPNIYYYWHKDDGFRAGECRNIGAKLAKYPYLFFLDTGVLLDKDVLKLHLNYHKENPNTALIGRVLGFSNFTNYSYQECLDKSRKLSTNFFMRTLDTSELYDERDLLYKESGVAFSDLPAPWLFFWTNHCSIEKASFLSVGGFDSHFKTWGGEDTEIAISLFSSGVNFDIVDRSWSLDLPHLKLNYESESDMNLAREKFIEKQKYIYGKHDLESVRAWLVHPYETLNPYLISLRKEQ